MKVQDLAEFVLQCPPTGRILLSRKAFEDLRYTSGDWFDVDMEAVKFELTPAEAKPETVLFGEFGRPILTAGGDETQG